HRQSPVKEHSSRARVGVGAIGRTAAKGKGVKERVLITGGAGFIGCHLCSALLAAGYQVRVLDDLVEQVHAGQKLNPILRETEFIVGTVRNAELIGQAL